MDSVCTKAGAGNSEDCGVVSVLQPDKHRGSTNHFKLLRIKDSRMDGKEVEDSKVVAFHGTIYYQNQAVPTSENRAAMGMQIVGIPYFCSYALSAHNITMNRHSIMLASAQ